ncbi:MAG: glycosyl transferase family 2, partial [Deltaproteobacteria bacterium HGW-Deltaproteobacteria-17]
IGSKALPGSEDRRPMVRKFATRSINLLLHWILGFEGSDTHGLKAFRRTALLPVATACRVTGDLFASELVIRAQRERIVIREIPIQLHEKRPPAINLIRRIPKVVRSLWTLRKVLGPPPRR